MLLEYGVLFVVAVLAGGWAIPAGLLIGLGPLGVYLTCIGASIVSTLLLLHLGRRYESQVLGRIVPNARARATSGSAQRLLDRWGLRGLALVGGVVLGPTITVLAALFLDVDLHRFTVLFIGSTAVVYAAVTIFWAWVV